VEKACIVEVDTFELVVADGGCFASEVEFVAGGERRRTLDDDRCSLGDGAFNRIDIGDAVGIRCDIVDCHSLRMAGVGEVSVERGIEVAAVI